MLKKSEEIDRLIPITKWGNYYDYPSVSSLRWMVFNEKTNGFHTVVRRVGSRVMLKEKAFFEWVEKQNTQKPC